jgi:hypothetical protein
MSIGTIWNHRDFIKREYGEEHATEFERIVKKYQAEQISIEQDRIIKLLGIWDCNNDRCDCDSINECIYRQDLIALIKGEK